MQTETTRPACSAAAGQITWVQSVVSRFFRAPSIFKCQQQGVVSCITVQPNNQVVGTPLNIIFIKTLDPWGNAYTLMQSEKSGIQFQGLNTLQVHKVIPIGELKQAKCGSGYV